MKRNGYSQSPLEWLQFALVWVLACFSTAALLALLGLVCKLTVQAFLFGWRLA